MSPVDSTAPQTFAPVEPLDAVSSAQLGTQGVAKLLADLANVAPSVVPHAAPTADVKYENKLAMVRLGMATSLYSALRAKHPPSASHSLRVALVCSAWSDRLRLDETLRERLEVAGLLHDIGKIGIPDQILRKPGKLTVEEQLSVSLCPQLGCEILRGCCADGELIDIIMHATAWYSGRRHQPKSEEDLHIGSRMLAIADAFDAMTTDHVYRPAMSRDAAMAQLLQGRGTQFDPDLADDYCQMMLHDAERLHRQTLLRWMQSSAPGEDDTRWSLRPASIGLESTLSPQNDCRRFHDQLLSNMGDGVIYVDRDNVIQGWNSAIEKLTGIPADAVLMSSWAPTLLGLVDEEGEVCEGSCPVRQAFSNSSHVAGQYSIRRNDGTIVPVRLHVVPVTSDQPGLCGVVLIAHDASQQRNLEARVESLHKQAMHDTLTKVANRAAFDRRLDELVSRRNETGAGFSLIICDIDHFKMVNDVHGHPAGDEALVTFAGVLSAHSRENDLVSRYGGEEFVMLSPDCDIATAARRAETIRIAVEQTRLPSIGNQAVTASFGVTEVQAGDTADSVLSRADRALLQAKDRGRNQVIQLGIGNCETSGVPKRRRGLLSWFDSSTESCVINTEIITPVPVSIAIEKLRGFIADHRAEIASVSEGNLRLRLNVQYRSKGRRSVDSTISYDVRLRLSESIYHTGTENRKTTQSRTIVKVELEPTKTRDRRRKELSICADQVIVSLKSYLMGQFAID
jgi:diguanylate cyclase (GGDEF)-like protein/PAS domain S-box-containing protein